MIKNATTTSVPWSKHVVFYVFFPPKEVIIPAHTPMFGVNWAGVNGWPGKWGTPLSLDGLFHGKSQSKRDDNWGYPHDLGNHHMFHEFFFGRVSPWSP